MAVSAGISKHLHKAAEGESVKAPRFNYLRPENLADAPPRITSEDLGNRVIDGLQTRGVRTIIEYPDAHHTLEFEPDPAPLFADLTRWLLDRSKT